MFEKRFILVIFIVGFFVLLALEPVAVKVASADPLPDWIVTINSPQNNKIYPSNSVTLSFNPLQDSPAVNFVSFSYVLDGQAALVTKGSTVLSSLSAGSHTLTLYGTYSYQGENQTYTNVVAVVYFSTIYSTAWLVFAASVLAVTLAIGLPLLIWRRQIISGFKRQKKQRFWVGFAILFLATLMFVPSILFFANAYLYPYYSFELMIDLFSDSFVDILIVLLFFMVVGILLMIFGTKKSLENQCLE